MVVYTAQGEVLMLRRTSPGNFWQSVTGSLRWGEMPSRAAQRELFEETGLRGGGRIRDCHHKVRFPIVPPWRDRYDPGVFFNTEHHFRLQLPSRRLVRLNAVEHSMARWLPIPQAARLASSWTNRDAILDLQRLFRL